MACDEQERVVYREQLPDGATVPTVTPLQWSEDSKVVTVITTDSQGTHTFKDTLNETRPGFERITTTDARGTWVRTIDTAHTNAQGNWLTRQTVHTPDPRCGPAQQAEPCTEWTVVKTRRISYWTAPQPGGP